MKTLLASAVLFLTLPLLAQSVPGAINYQGRLTDNTPSQTPGARTAAADRGKHSDAGNPGKGHRKE